MVELRRGKVTLPADDQLLLNVSDYICFNNSHKFQHQFKLQRKRENFF